MPIFACVRRALGRGLMKKFSREAQKKMTEDAVRGRWYNLVRLEEIPAFAAWLTDDFHEWQGQSPDAGECLRAYRDGRTIIVRYDGKHTRCTRAVMALWYTFECFTTGREAT